MVYEHIKCGWRTIADRRIYFRSRWEANYARYLQWLKALNEIDDWEHEPKKFWFEKIKSGTRCYTPDFCVKRLDKSHYWVEVKGYMDPKSFTKLKRFKKYYPKEELILVERPWFAKNRDGLSIVIEDWET